VGGRHRSAVTGDLRSRDHDGHRRAVRDSLRPAAARAGGAAAHPRLGIRARRHLRFDRDAVRQSRVRRAL
jgi:hypothetical protein